jgi:hypothetical protein
MPIKSKTYEINLILSIPIFSAFGLDDTVYGKTASMQYKVQDKCCGARRGVTKSKPAE